MLGVRAEGEVAFYSRFFAVEEYRAGAVSHPSRRTGEVRVARHVRTERESVEVSPAPEPLGLAVNDNRPALGHAAGGLRAARVLHPRHHHVLAVGTEEEVGAVLEGIRLVVVDHDEGLAGGGAPDIADLRRVRRELQPGCERLQLLIRS